jgi:hypothetical protein
MWLKALKDFDYWPPADCPRVRLHAAKDEIVNVESSYSEHLIRNGGAERAAPPSPPPPPPDPLMEPRRIAASKRGDGEPDQEGWSYEAATLRSPPGELVSKFQAGLLDVPRLAQEEDRSQRLAGLIRITKTPEEIVIERLRALLRAYVLEQWRSDNISVFGFCHESNRREPLNPASHEYLKFEGFNAENTKYPRHYSEVLFYIKEEERQSEATAPFPIIEDAASQPDQPSDVRRVSPAKWLCSWVKEKRHRTRDATIAEMRKIYPKLTGRQALTHWSSFASAHPELSRRGRKSKQRTN